MAPSVSVRVRRLDAIFAMAGGTVETLWPLQCVSVIVVIVVVDFLFMEAVHSFWVQESPVSTTVFVHGWCYYLS